MNSSGNANLTNYTITQPSGITGSISLATLTAPGAPGQGTVTFESVTLTKPTTGLSSFDSHLELEYGWNTVNNSAGVSNWQTGLAFNGLNANTTYYFFARYKADPTKNNVSPASSVRTITTSALPTVPFNITFNQIADVSLPTITGPTIFRFSGSSTATLTLDNPGQYDSISWRVNNTDVTGANSSFTLSAANTAYNLIGEHFLTVTVVRGGVPYNKTVSFRVAY